VTQTTSIEFAWNDVGVPTYTFRLDGSEYVLDRTSVVTTLAEGQHWWAVQAVNDLGEESGYGENWLVEVDTTPPPRPTLLTPDDGTETASTSIDFNWTGVGAPTYTLRVDGSVYNTSETSMLLTLTEGGHTWSVRSVDAVGNTLGYTDTWTVLVDTTPPPVPPLSSPENNAAVNDRPVTFVWQEVGAADSYDLRVVGIDPPRDPFIVTVPAGTVQAARDLLDGTYTWQVRARDRVGNVSAYSAPWTLTVDTVPPPAPTLVGPPDGSSTDDQEILFDWTDVAEPGVTYDLWVDADPPYRELAGSQYWLALPHGLHSWRVRAADAVGNVSYYTADWSLMVDLVSPTLNIVTPRTGDVVTSTHRPTLYISGTASDVGTGIELIEVDLGNGWQAASGTASWSTWSYDWEIPVWDLRPRNIRVRAWDEAGNSTETAAAVWVDTQPPTTYDLVHNQGTYVNGPVVYSWSTLPDEAGILDYEIRITNTLGFNGLWPTNDPTYSFGGATQEGQEYYAWARSRDGRGNWGSWSARSPVVIPDLSPPVILHPEILEDSSFLHADGLTLYYTSAMSVSQLVEITGISVDSVSRPVRVSFSRAFDDQPLDELVRFDPWSSAQPPLYGYHVDPGETASGEIVATVYDAAGNTATQSYQYEPDSTAPESITDAPLYATSTPIFVDYDAVDSQCGVGPVQLYYRHADSGGWQPAPAPGGLRTGESDTFWFLPPHGDGTYEFASRAKDLLGNQEGGAFVAQSSTIYDTTQPSSTVVWTPRYSAGNTITGTWEAIPSQAPVTSVDLWVRHQINETLPGVWIEVDTFVISGGGGTVTGTFEYDTLEDGTYYFATVAHDAAGKHEPEPHGDGDRYTIRDSEIDAPIDVTLVQSEEWSTDNDFEIVWTNPDDLSGIVAAIYQLYPEWGPPLDPVREYVFDPPEIEGIHVPEEGRYTLWLWLEDKAGNQGMPAPAIPQTVLKYDESISAPISLTVQPEGWSRTNEFSVSWTNPEDVSGITGAYYKLDTPPFWAEDGTWWYGADLEQFDVITVPNEGAHTLYVWLKDVAGNVDHRKWASVPLRYDVSEPYEVSMIVPSLSTSVRFEVGWSASDFHSKIVSYTVDVRGCPEYEWHPLVISTTETSAYYHARCADDVFDFRVTAYDSAGNSAQDEARTRVDVQRVYLPIDMVRSQWRPWHRQDIYEENDTWSDAYGPIESLTMYRSYIWDETDKKDLYYFVPSTNNKVTLTLDDMQSGVDLDLAVFVHSASQGDYVLIGWNPEYGNKPELIELDSVQKGRKYWVGVIPDKIRKSTDPDWRPNEYTLRVVYR
jgi:hypothetical protein